MNSCGALIPIFPRWKQSASMHSPQLSPSSPRPSFSSPSSPFLSFSPLPVFSSSSGASLHCFRCCANPSSLTLVHSSPISGKLVGHSWTPAPFSPSPNLGNSPLHLAPCSAPPPQPPPPLHLVLRSFSTQTSTSFTSNIDFTLIYAVSNMREP